MDIPLPRREQTWRDSAWWHATRQSLISGAMIMVLAFPLVAWFASQLMALSHQQLEICQMLVELAKGGLMMIPHLWAYFFALERIAKQKNQNFYQR
jgi:uncharacterized PurR-regulated membrane protein YhhQ (DUF165 family)